MKFHAATIPADYNPNDGGPIYRSLHSVHVDYGGYPSLGPCGGDQGHTSVGKRRTGRTGYDRILESRHHVVEGKLAIATANFIYIG